MALASCACRFTSRASIFLSISLLCTNRDVMYRQGYSYLKCCLIPAVSIKGYLIIQFTALHLPQGVGLFFVEYKVKHDFILIGMIGVLVIILSSWVTLYFCGVESTDSTKENQPIIVVIKETVNVTQQSK